MSSAITSRKQETYPYDDLSPGNYIRIFYLDAAETKDHPIVGHLETVDLNGYVPKYEALSWCWGSQARSETLQLRDEKTKKRWRIRITSNLAQALRCLRRYPEGYLDQRPLWVDAICIHMDNPLERAHQVAQMNLVYGRATNVCVWLDENPPTGQRYGYTTQEIFDFIENKLLDLAAFDGIIQTRANARRWLAIVQLMTKQWFSRRWVIQEIALAHKATLHCGDATMKWQTFAHAVSLFVKAESSDHQLSKIVSMDETLNYKQGIFWDVDRMGAISLVDITTANVYNPARGIKQPVSSLEALVSMLPMFESTSPVDTIYALLAVAKDTTPEAEGIKQTEIDFEKTWKYVKRFGDHEQSLQKLYKARKVAEMLAAGLRSKPYIVSYSKPVVDVYKDFVEFCIYQSRSLDIICRPWAPKPPKKAKEESRSARSEEGYPNEQSSSSSESDVTEGSESEDEQAPLEYLRLAKSWSGALGPSNSSPPLPSLDPPEPRAKRSSTQMNGDSDYNEGFEVAMPRNPPRPAKRPKQSHTTIQNEKDLDQRQEMPTWIADRKHIAFTLLTADESMARMERKNADPLVGSPDNKPYQASGTRQVRMGKIRFLRRGEYDQSLFVEGFVLDRIEECEQPSDLSNIPPSWFTFVDYGPDSTKRSPPIELYRTLIADRGPKGTPPPPYYFLAYNEVLKNRMTTLEIKDAINEGKIVITEFLERVRQVTFNRRIMKTSTPMKVGKNGKPKLRLGLAPKDTRSKKEDAQGGDMICILYGLSVPVILRRHVKTEDQKRADREAREQQLPEAYRNAVRTIERHWSFMKALKAAIYFMKDEWPGYDKWMPQWREDIRGKFSKVWLDHINTEFEEREKTVRSSTNVHTQPHTLKVERLQKNQTGEQREKMWQSMVEEWKTMLNNGDDYAFKKPTVTDKPIAASSIDSNEYYEVVGECYVDQMMDGEALSYKQAKGIPDTVFELR